MPIAIFICGIAAVISQTIIIREMIAFFSGNELLSGIVFFLWLLLTGLGSLFYSMISSDKEPEKKYAILVFLLCPALIFSFLFIRNAPGIFLLPFGEFVAFHKIIIISLITLCPTCIIFGSLFPAASRILKPQKVYLIESMGSFFGGIILSFILISFIPPSGIFVLVISSLIFSGYLCLKKKILLFLSVMPLLLFVGINKIELKLKKIQMSGQNLIGVYESKYSNISITKSETQLNFYTSGVFDFAYPDIYSSEEGVHYPLLLHSNPEAVLLVGGGVGGGIEEVLKHMNVKRLVYLELDPKIITVAEKYINSRIPDDRLITVVSDGRYYIKKTEEIFDCIIINLPDPINAQLNRYYTLEFFQEAKTRIKQNGIFSIRVSYTPDILSPIYSQFLGTIKNTLNKVFKNVYILPVSKATYIGTDRKIDGDISEILKKNIRERNLNLHYVNENFFDYNLSEERIRYINESIERAVFYTNTDLKPICYYFSTLLWGGIVSENLKNLFIILFNIHSGLFFLILIPALFFLHRKNIVYLSVFTAGATGISSEIILIILFQVFFGYLYNWIGIIIGLFMLGLALGTLFLININKIFKSMDKFKKSRLLAVIHMAISIYFLTILFFSVTRIYCTDYIIAILVFIGGFLGGNHFPLAIELTGMRNAGILYGIDLFGASFGALITSIIFIPVLGILNTSLIFIILSLIVGLGLLVYN